MKIITLLLCCLPITCFSQTNDSRLAGLDTAFARIMKDWKAPGFAIAIVEKNKVIYAKGFGYKDWEKKVPVTEHTQFAIGSCTKAFTASLVGMLVKDGKVELDKPVRTYLPALNFHSNEMNNNITLRDMMSHRTGLSRYDYLWYFFPTRSKDTLMQRIQYMEPSEPLRRKYQYNNFMFMLQGLVVEKLTSKSWEENIREKIFQPLGMNNSNVSLMEWMKAKDLAIGYYLKKDSIMEKMDYYDISGMGPAGSINSSVSDMAKWLMVWINGGKFNGKEVLPSSYVTEAISSQMVASGGLPSKERPDNFLSNYGLGWSLASYRGHYRVDHGGNINGFSANAAFFPSDSIGIVVLTNQNGSAVPNLVRNLVSDRLLGLKYRDWQSQVFSADTAAKAKAKEAKKTEVSNRKRGTSPSHPLKDYAGLYIAPGKESFELSLKGDSMFMFLPNEKFYLQHYHYDIFNLLDKDDLKDNDTTIIDRLRISFRMDESGNITSAALPLEGPAKPIVFTKTEKAKPLSKDSLQKYVGDFTLNGTIAKVYIKGEKTLHLFVTGQPEYELVSVGKDKFNIKNLSGFSLQFSGNAKGEISEVMFIQPNGSFKAVRVVSP